MREISDEYMKEMIGRAREYCIVLLKSTAKRGDEAAGKIVWEHGRRNFQLREEGLLSIVCPINDGSEYSGVGIFNASAEKTREIMEGDPGVAAGIFTYEIHPCRGFPGSSLPG
jgi:hypothetical protein